MSSFRVISANERIRPVRALVLTENAYGRCLDLVDIRRWLRVGHDIFKAEKVDILFNQARSDIMPSLLETASQLNLRVSLRTNAAFAPADMAPLAEYGLLDVYLTPASLEAPHLDAWFTACREAGLPVRLQLQAPFDRTFDADKAAERIASAGVTVVNVAFTDPFCERDPMAGSAGAIPAIRHMNALVRALRARQIEANLLGLPFCHVETDNLVCAANGQQFALDHQQYIFAAYDFAAKVFPCRPNAIGKAVMILLGRNTMTTGYVDNKLLPWIVEGAYRHMLLLAFRKLTRPLRIIRGKPKPVPENEDAYLRETERVRRRNERNLEPACIPCRFKRICDHKTAAFTRMAPGVGVQTQAGETVPAPMALSAGQAKYYDAVDEPRLAFGERDLALVKAAHDIVMKQSPTREILSDDYEVEGQWTHHMPGGNRWHSFSNTEKLSTVLARVTPPVTLSYTLGGGIAEFAGFSFGRHCKILCPMEAYSHKLVLHVDADGYYVLLRDGLPVRPVEFEGMPYAPPRLAGMLEPRISLWNIDSSIVTQTVLAWEGGAGAQRAAGITYSVVVVSTRYARRLQAVLLSIAHQEGFDLSRIEVVISYVPGIDATDDLIESMRAAYPQLRIVRSPFDQAYALSKGFLINESIQAASGEWIVLLDSDILFAPNWFATMDTIAATASFVAPDGRKMLTPDTTARILLGEIEPWREWDALLAGEGEFRRREADGVPIGFCQCVRKTCMEKVRYIELNHFEGADWLFGFHMRENYGTEVRLAGIPVLHLDHGGSQWYGTQKHR